MEAAAPPGASGSAKYRPIVELGQGGMARVYLAASEGPAGFQKLVVLKQIQGQLADDPEFLTMFLDEARLAARLNHPNVVQTYEVGDEGGRYFMCMEYLEGQPLNRVWSRIGAHKVDRPPETRLTLGMQLRILVETLAGLQYAHDLADYDGKPLNVVHRDISPHNVFVTYAGQVKVVDFGIAKATSSSIETRTGMLKGKLAYMSPEQARGERVDRRADVFSVGVMLWETLTGKRLFKGMSEATILHRLTLGELPRPSAESPDVPEPLETICMKALAQDRDERYASAADLASDLEQALEGVDRGTLREAGKRMAAAFAADRERVKQVVEAQMAKAASAPIPSVSDAEPDPDLPRLVDESGSRSRVRAEGPTSRTGETPLVQSTGAPRAGGRPLVLAASLVTLAALGGGGALLLRSPAPPPSPSAPGPSAEGPASPPPLAPTPSLAASPAAQAPSATLAPSASSPAAPASTGSAPSGAPLATAPPAGAKRPPGAKPSAAPTAGAGPLPDDFGI